MAEEDAQHQREMEHAALTTAVEEVKRGQLYGLIIGSLALVASIIAVALHAERTAMVIGGATVLGLVSVFFVGRLKKQ